MHVKIKLYQSLHRSRAQDCQPASLPILHVANTETHLSNGPGPLGLMLQVGFRVPPSFLNKPLHLQAPALQGNLHLGERAVDAQHLPQLLA